MPGHQGLAQTRGFPTRGAGRFHQGRKPEAPSQALSKCTSTSNTSDEEVEGVATPPLQLASASPPPGRRLPQRYPLLPHWSSHLASYFWPRGRRSETRLGGGCVWQIPRPVLRGWPHPVGRPLSLPSPAPTPSPPLVPALGQGRPWPRLGCSRWGARKGKWCSLPRLSSSAPSPTGSRALELERGLHPDFTHLSPGKGWVLYKADSPPSCGP